MSRRLLLISNSTNYGEQYLEYTIPHIRDFLPEETGEVLFVPYAGVSMSYDEYSKKVETVFNRMGYGVKSLHKSTDPVDEVKNAGAIVVGGGNTFHLVHMMHKTGVMAAIREKVSGGTPYIGWSAGSNVACPSLKTTNDMPIIQPESFETLDWMRQQGVRFVPIYGRQAFKVDGRFVFWGGVTVEANGGGPGLIEQLTDAALKAGVEIRYETRAIELVREQDRVTGVKVRHHGEVEELAATTVVLASGGFEANAEWRTRYLGPGWDVAKVRGSRFNVGDGIRMALDIGASPVGNWSGSHAVAWDMNAPEFGDLKIGDSFSKLSYPFGIMVNARGERFLDEGADFRNYTYAKYGREILNQPDQLAWQVFDQKVTHLLRDEYRIREVTTVKADTLEGLAERLEGVDPEGFLATVAAYNDAVDVDTPFDPNVKDGRGTTGITPRKTNWANRLDEPPYEAFLTTCGITFTFGGLRISPDRAAVLDHDGREIPGLFACGELVGGLFYFNYPGGTGLTSGSVFGRIAGQTAATVASS